MLTALLIISGVILLIFIHELGHFLAAKQAGIKVEEFGFGFPPRIWGIKKGETLYSINWLPFGGFVRIYGENKARLIERAEETGEVLEEKRAFYAQSLWRRFTVVAAGISINFIAGWILLSLTLMIGAPQRVVVTDIQPNSPAAKAGVVAGDIVSGFSNADEFVSFTRGNQGKMISLTISHNGKQQSLSMELRKATKDEAPFGAALATSGMPAMPILSALWEGLIRSVEAVGQIFIAFGRLIGDLFSSAQVPENIVGPVGIFKMSSSFGGLGFAYVLQMIAMISLNLAALNAIPFPALDGGRILFMIIEKIKGSPIKPNVELWANVSSFGFLIILMLIITGRDIWKLF